MSMSPRLSSSSKWTSLPPELLQQIKGIFEDTFKDHLGGRSIITEGRIYPEELLFRVGLSPKATLKQTNFEASMDYDKKKQKLMDLVNIMLDATGSMVEQLLTEDVTEFPREWTEYEIQNLKVYLQESVINTELEKNADKILGVEDTLVSSDDDSEEIEYIKKTLGVDEE